MLVMVTTSESVNSKLEALAVWDLSSGNYLINSRFLATSLRGN
jgi:hypothetical protein